MNRKSFLASLLTLPFVVKKILSDKGDNQHQSITGKVVDSDGKPATIKWKQINGNVSDVRWIGANNVSTGINNIVIGQEAAPQYTWIEDNGMLVVNGRLEYKMK
jgi:hypothetical protein